MDKLDKWSEIVENVFLGLDPIVGTSNDKEFNIHFDDPNSLETKLQAHANIYACLYGTTWETPFCFQCPFPFDMTGAQKIKTIDKRNKIIMKTYEEEKTMYQQIADICEVDALLLFSGFEKDDFDGKQFLIGLTNIQNTSVKYTIDDWTNAKRLQIELIPFDECATCRKKGKLFRCSRCKKALYCSVECQKKSWIESHSKLCW